MTAPTKALRRLPRYRRTASVSEFVLTERDLDILMRIESYRVASSEHLQALISGSAQGILRRLQKLFHAGYLDRLLPRHVEGGGSAKMVYAVTNKGIRALLEDGRLEHASATDWNAKNRSLHDLSIAHTLLVSQVRAVIELATATRPNLRLLFWREGRDLQDAVEVSLPEGYRRVPVAPDAYFALEDAKGRMNFFLEADRGTMTLKRFTAKLKAFAAYFEERRQQDKFGIRYFRVLTVTTSPTRAQNLISAGGAEDDVRSLGRLFLFSDETALSLKTPERVLGNIWTAVTGEEISLISGPCTGPSNNLKEKVTI
ncbi:MAG: replication-relaxation family protein [Candidatus Acidiferrales bacterium]